MTAREQGFLLLTSTLGDPARKKLTTAQFRTLAMRARSMERPDTERDMTAEDLVTIGYDRATAQRIITLLSQQEQLAWYVQKARKQDCYPITRISENYPAILRYRLGTDCPGTLWAKGDASLLELPGISLVGSRELKAANMDFAYAVGAQAALQGFVLISGNARGADRIAQESCLAHGGKVISVIADALEACPLRNNVLYLAEDGFDLAFSSQRALCRNRVIHCLGQKTFVAQSGLHKGGTWNGTVKNLQHNWSPVFCYDDKSTAAEALEQMGAVLITKQALGDISVLQTDTLNFIDQ